MIADAMYLKSEGQFFLEQKPSFKLLSSTLVRSPQYSSVVSTDMAFVVGVSSNRTWTELKSRLLKVHFNNSGNNNPKALFSDCNQSLTSCTPN